MAEAAQSIASRMVNSGSFISRRKKDASYMHIHMHIHRYVFCVGGGVGCLLPIILISTTIARHIAEEEEGEVRYLEDKEAIIDSVTRRPKHACRNVH